MSSISRRELGLATLGGAVALLVPTAAYAVSVKPMPEGQELPTLDEEWPPVGTPSLGSEPPLPIEREIGEVILNGAPLRSTPLGVARYFDQIGRSVKKTADFPSLAQRTDLPDRDRKELTRYVGEWSRKYNPVILSFFTATGRKPEGDCTPWCSAFVNWCLMRSREGYPKLEELEGKGNPGARTRSAASKSFRTWGTETTTPTDGDIVVFENKSDPEHGHVGFYREMNDTDRAWAKEKKVNLDDFVKVLGGNQGRRRDIDQLASSCKDATYYGGSVTITFFPRDARRHTFRTHPSLHSLWG